LKGVVIDWITPKGQPLNPPLMRNIKTDRGFNHDLTGSLLCPAGLDWSDVECAMSFSQPESSDALQNKGESSSWPSAGLRRSLANIPLL
jgi:hypothetical protein